MQATDPEQATFGEHRLHEAINSVTSRAIADVPRRVSAAHRKFTKGSEQNHDITMLALEYIGKKHETADTHVLAHAHDAAACFISTQLESVFAAPIAIHDLQSDVEQILAALPRDNEVHLHLDFDEDVAEVSLTYPAPAYNPLLHLSELCANRMDYTITDDGGNMITLWKKLS